MAGEETLVSCIRHGHAQGGLLGDVAEPGKVIPFTMPEPLTTPVAKSAKKRGAMPA